MYPYQHSNLYYNSIFCSQFSYRTRLVSAANHAQSNVQSVAASGDFCVFRYHLPERRLFAAFLVNKVTCLRQIKFERIRHFTACLTTLIECQFWFNLLS